MRISDWSSDVCSSDLMKPAPFAALLAGGAAGVDASTTAREGKMREKGGKSGMAGVGGTRLGQLSDVIASGAKQSRAVYTTLDCFAPLAMTIQMNPSRGFGDGGVSGVCLIEGRNRRCRSFPMSLSASLLAVLLAVQIGRAHV